MSKAREQNGRAALATDAPEADPAAAESEDTLSPQAEPAAAAAGDPATPEAEDPQRRVLFRLEDARAELARERYGSGSRRRPRRRWRAAKLYENGWLLTLVLLEGCSILERGRMLVEWAEPWGWDRLTEYRAELVRLAAQQPRLAARLRPRRRAAAEGRAQRRFDQLIASTGGPLVGGFVADEDAGPRPEPVPDRVGRRRRILLRAGLAVALVGVAALFVAVLRDDVANRDSLGPAFVGAEGGTDRPPAGGAAGEARRNRAQRSERRAERDAGSGDRPNKHKPEPEPEPAPAPAPEPEPAAEPAATTPSPAPASEPATQAPAPAPAPTPAPAPAPEPAPSGGGQSECFSFEC